MSGTKINIRIPTYSREACLRNALSYRRNDYKFDFPFEIVICGNGSTDAAGACILISIQQKLAA